MEFIAIIVIGGLILMLIRSQKTQAGRPSTGEKRRSAEMAQRRWAAVRRVAEEDVTQFGQQIASTPVAANLPEEGRQDFDDALAAYERAKEAMAAAQQPDDLAWVSKSIDDGRFALSRLQARLADQPLPERRPACFFDQRHGLSVGDTSWAPPSGVPRDVPVCAACAARIDDGMDPEVRQVETANGPRPYYDAGPEYGPWARGWYAASGLHVMNTVMLGMLLGNAIYFPPGYDYFGGDAGGDGGGGWDGGDGGGGEGDAGGGDFGGGDFGGGDFGGGDFGGGGF